MLRPATPLSVILVIAFVLTLLAVLSAPVIRAIPLGQYDGTTYGVFGYCTSGRCSYAVGYTAPNDASNTGSDDSFDLSSDNTRHTLTNILIVHPVACLFQLVLVILSLVAHFHSPSHSSRYLLALIIFMLPTLLLTLLSFLVDILLFIPHVGWAGWLVLAAVVLDVLGGIMLCAMRRTLVSRKARKKRIAENAEMSGENFYNRQASERAAAAPSARADSPPPIDDQPSIPMVNGVAGADKLPSFATYEQSRVSDDRVPLNERTETATTTSSLHGRPSQDGSEYYGGQGRGGSMNMNRGRGGRPYGPPRDEFGNPLPPSNAFGPRPQDGRGGFRGRGGPNMGPRGGYASRGGPVRGGMGPAFGADAAAGALAGSRGPPPGYTNDDYQMQDRPNMGGYGYGQRRQSPGPPSAPGYGQRRASPGPPSAPGYGRSPSAGRHQAPGEPLVPGYGRVPMSQEDGQYARAESPPPLPGTEQHAVSGVARAESPPPLLPQPPMHAAEMEAPQELMIGQAVEMDERTGSPAATPTVGHGGFGRVDSPLRQNFVPHSPSSMYSSQPSQLQHDSAAYVPARAAWNSQRHETPPAELAGNMTATVSPPAELPHQRKASDSYYEDVDPRFSHDQQNTPAVSMSTHPNASTSNPPLNPQHLAPQRMQHNNSYDSTSQASHFTSISERGVNPAWEESDHQGRPVANRGLPRQQDVLQSNPDFQLPTNTRGQGAAGGAGGYGAVAY